MSILKRQVARVFQPLLVPKRYKGARGGRGSGKSHFFAEQVIIEHLEDQSRDNNTVCIREIQKDLKQSSKKVIEQKIVKLGVGHLFRVLTTHIVCPGGGSILFQGMQDHTAESIKSLEGMKRAWIEEAHTLSERSLSLLRPTIRADGSEIWASWNPTSEKDAIDKFLWQQKPDNATVVEANWRDNPWWNEVLEKERLLELERYPDRYEHTYAGGYATVLEGAYYAKELAEAKQDGRICRLAPERLLPVWAFWDIGGAGARADAMAIWLVQFVGKEIWCLDYIEGQGQVLGYYTDMLRERGWARAKCVLPHDGTNTNNFTGKRFADHLRDAEFEVEVKPNQGAGAAKARIEASRRWFGRMWFDEKKTEPGRKALGWYHEKRDPERNIGLGPEHNWASNGADAFGLMACVYDEPSRKKAGNPVPVFKPLDPITNY